MTTVIYCPNCHLDGDLPDDQLGTRVGCPRCRHEFTAAYSPGPDDSAVWVGNGPPPVTPVPANTLPADAVRPADRPEVTPENAAAHVGWVQQETVRFEGYVAVQLSQLRDRREELARAESDAAAAFVAREQELTRIRADLTARAEGLDRREAELGERQAALARRADELDRQDRAIQRRLAEVEEVEDELREELERRAAAVERDRRAVEEASRAARSRATAAPPAPDLLESWMA